VTVDAAVTATVNNFARPESIGADIQAEATVRPTRTVAFFQEQSMTTLLIATRNAHKVQEIRTILGSEFQCLTLTEFPGAPEAVEDAPTFAGNATKKAATLAHWLASGSPARIPEGVDLNKTFALADDSGLEVDALGGAPGVHSARFAALDFGASGNSATPDNNAKLLRLLKEVPDERRTARFHCVLALVPALHSGGAASVRSANVVLFDGVCEGRIGHEERGRGGFGYDPLFFPTGFDRTFSELGEDAKNRLSHRGKALQKLKAHLVKDKTGPS
jgi:XTP/dITP diphosphohydrolase